MSAADVVLDRATGATTPPVGVPTPRRSPGRGLAVVPEFGPYDELADLAHGLYIDGFNDRSVLACRTWLRLTEAAGDVVTSRYLRYIEAVALLELGRSDAAIDAAQALLADLGEEVEPVWRAKALAVVAEGSTRLTEHGRAIAALAEAHWLTRMIDPTSYGHLSANMAVALALRSVNLLEQADEALTGIGSSTSTEVQVLLVQESALLSAYWGASLVLIGRGAEAGSRFRDAASRALRLQRLARAVDQEQMVARGEVVEAFALMHLGDDALAGARARHAGARFEARPELVESHLLHLVLARQEAAEGHFAAASHRLQDLVVEVERTAREVWTATARAELASVHEAEHGPHPGVDQWREVARTALERVWSEREGRYAAFTDRNHLRELAAETVRVGREIQQDPLTGLGNRRLLDDVLAEDLLAGDDARWALFVDVDSFKAINDTWSHAVGDEVLRTIADILRAASRDDDVLVRYGGDEFLVLPGGGREAASTIARRVHREVAQWPWAHTADGLAVTVSIGVGRTEPVSARPLEGADAALLAAKREGRDRVVVA